MDVYQARRERLRELLAQEFDGASLLVTHLPNVRYLTGFTGSNAVVALGPDRASDLLGTDGRYIDQVALQAPDVAVVIDRDTLRALIPIVGPDGLAVESSLTVGQLAEVRELAPEPTVAEGLVERLRLVKDEAEIDALAAACRITVQALDALCDHMAPGTSERRLARMLESLFGDMGAEDRAFDTIVGSGPNAAIPHHCPGDRELRPGDLVVVDAGARVDGYHADMTRTFLVGADPEPWQSHAHGAVLAAQEAARNACLPGAEGRHIDTQAREVLHDAGLEDRFTHGLGHGVGLEIHEAPFMGRRATASIGADMVITVEPGVYLPGQGGVRIEDTVVVTADGPRVLTEASRGLRVVG